MGGQVHNPNLVRLSAHPILESIARFINIGVYDRDGGHADPRIRLDLRSKEMDPALVEQVLRIETCCVRCGAPIFPFRKRRGGGGRVPGLKSGIYVAVSCPRSRNPGCCNGDDARDEYVAIRVRVCQILGVDPEAYSTRLPDERGGRRRAKKEQSGTEPLPLRMVPPAEKKTDPVQEHDPGPQEHVKPPACDECDAKKAPVEVGAAPPPVAGATVPVEIPRCCRYYRIPGKPDLTPMRCCIDVGHLGEHQYRDPDGSLIMEWSDLDPNCGSIPLAEHEAVLDFLSEYRKIAQSARELPRKGSLWRGKIGFIKQGNAAVFMATSAMRGRVVDVTGWTVKAVRFPPQVVFSYPRQGDFEYQHTMSLEQFLKMFELEGEP